MREFIGKVFDIPFIMILICILFCVTTWSAIFFFHITSLWIRFPIILITIYTSCLSLYWLYLFITSKRYKDELEVWEVIQKKSISLSLSMELNLIFSIIYSYSANRYKSAWFAFVAFFYISLTLARFILLREFCFEIESMKSQYKRYITVGYFMLFMMICLFLMILMVVNSNYVVYYPGITIYIAAIFSLYLIIAAVYGFLKYRKYNSPLLSANQMISISAALLGILSLQTAILSRYPLYPELVHQLNIITGILIFSIMIFMSLYMIFHGSHMIAHGIDEDEKADVL